MLLSARLTWLLLGGVFAVNIYRAATQGVTIDEAFTYQHFVAPPLAQVMTSYDVNHHVLNSLLAAVTVTGRDGHTSHALPRAQLADLLRAAGRI